MATTKKKALSITDKMRLSDEVCQYIERLAPSINFDTPISKEEIKEAETISASLAAYFSTRESEILQFWPYFKGCGRIHACKGDIICDDRLIEIKAGDRHFRITDIRQIITYLSLNSISRQYRIENIALVNPRRGLSFYITVDVLIEDCSRRKPVDVFGDIIDFLSSEIIST
jgi:hypothetical protein